MLIEIIHRRSGVDIAKLKWIATTASRRYKSYDIPKRSGGFRRIEHPSRELKAIQRWVTRAILQQLPVHHCATAYKPGAKISNNAARHRTSNYTLRIDFNNFFPSFSIDHIINFLNKCNTEYLLNMTEEDVLFAAQVVTKDRHLVIGAPTSPALTNTMLYNFDETIHDYSQSKGLTYTRYADDLFFSGMNFNSLKDVEVDVTHISASYHYGNLTVNAEKTAYLSRKYSRKITGMVITPDRKISIGRDKKREIKALIHQYKNNNCENPDYLMGLLAFASDAEPVFVERLTKKYGQEVIAEILNQPPKP